MAALIADLTACISDQEKYEDMAKRMLQKKYDEEFEVVQYLGAEHTEDFFEVTAVSEKNPDVIFEARISRDGAYLDDEYAKAKACHEIEEQMLQNLDENVGYAAIHVETTGERMAVYFHISPTEDDPGKLCQAIRDVFAGMDDSDGNMQLYIVDEEMLGKVMAYFDENAKVYYEYDKLLEGVPSLIIPFEQGMIQISEEDFCERTGDRL